MSPVPLAARARRAIPTASSLVLAAAVVVTPASGQPSPRNLARPATADGQPETAQNVPSVTNVPAVPTRRLSALDVGSRRLVATGLRDSPTFRRLLDVLDGSDVIVLARSHHVLRVRGQLEFYGCAGGYRRVLITVRWPAFEIDTVAVMAHELQHAVEIAQTPWARDAETLRRLYAKLGRPSIEGDYETHEAEAVERRVRAELWQARRESRRPAAAARGRQ